jgi:hypothetical protein
MPQAVQSLNIEINGRVNPQVLRMISDMEKRLKDFGASTRTQSAILNRFYSQAFDGANKAARTTDKLVESMRRVGEIAGGVSIGAMFSEGLDLAIDKMRQLVDLGKEAFSKAADFQRTTEQLQIEMGGSALQASQAMKQLQYWSYPIQDGAVSEAYRQLLSSGFSPEEALKREKQLGDIAASTTPSGESASQHLKALNEAYNKSIKGGTILERNLYMFEDAGVKIRPFLEQAMHMQTGSLGSLQDEESLTRLRKAIKKGELSANTLSLFLDQATSATGKYYQGAQKMSHDALGALSTFQDKWDFFVRSVGSLTLDLVTDILNAINDSFSFEKYTEIQDWFDKVRGQIDSVFRAIGSYMSTVASPDIMRHLEAVGDVFGQMFKHMTCGFDIAKMYTSVDIPNVGRVDVMNATGDQYMAEFTKGIDSALDKLREFGVRLDAIMTRLEPFIKVFNAMTSMFQVIDDFLYGKMLPFFMDKMWAALDRLQDKLHEMFPWLVPGSSGTTAAADKAERLKYWAPPDTSPLPSGYDKYGPPHSGEPLKPWFHGAYQSNVWDPILESEAAKYAINPILLKAIARQEGVSAGDFNPMGISPGGGGPTHYGSVAAGAAGIDDYIGKHLSRFKKVDPNNPSSVDEFSKWYSPPGAGNDPFGTNSSEGSGIKSWMNKLSQPTTQIIYNIHAVDTTGIQRVLEDHGQVIKDHLSRLAGLDNERYAPI